MGKIVLLELSPSVPNLGKFIVMPRYGMLTIASILSDRTDYEVSLLFQPYVGSIDVESVVREEPKFIMVNGLTTTALENEVFIARLRERLGGSVPVIAGGEHATMFPEEAKIYADYILAYEGDDTSVQLLSALEEKDPVSRDSMLSQVPGLHYRDLSGKWRFNHHPVRIDQIDYRYDFSVVHGAEYAGQRFRTAHMPIQTSRGCKFSCSFCTWISLYGKSGYCVRPVEDVLHDIVHTIEYTDVRNFVVCDNLFGGDIAYTEELLHQVIRAFEDRKDRPVMTVLCRADQFVEGPGAIPEKTIKLMARAGVANVCLGLESISSRSLIQMRKRSDLQKYYVAAENLRRNGLNIPSTFVAGFDGDSYEDVVNIAEFGERIGLFNIQVYARSIAPGTVDDMLSEGRNIPGGHNKYRNGHAVNILPARMLPSELQRAVFEAPFRFHRGSGIKDRLALRAFQMIWNGLEPHYAGLQTLEREILVPEGIYRYADAGYVLNDKALHALVEDEERYEAFARKAAAIFRNADRLAPDHLGQAMETTAIA